MRRKLASEYLLQVHGVSLTAATLAKLAVQGGSPPFWKDGRFPVYGRDQLDEFATARLGRLRANTSDQDGTSEVRTTKLQIESNSTQ
jgi:hypothetical protein